MPDPSNVELAYVWSATNPHRVYVLCFELNWRRPIRIVESRRHQWERVYPP